MTPLEYRRENGIFQVVKLVFQDVKIKRVWDSCNRSCFCNHMYKHTSCQMIKITCIMDFPNAHQWFAKGEGGYVGKQQTFHDDKLYLTIVFIIIWEPYGDDSCGFSHSYGSFPRGQSEITWLVLKLRSKWCLYRHVNYRTWIVDPIAS